MAKTWLILGAVLIALSLGAWFTRERCPRVANRESHAGWVAYRAGDIEGALQRFRAAAAACPTHLDARIGIGYAELRLGQPALARPNFDAALELDSTSVDALVGDGVASYQLGDLARSWARLTRARALAPGRRDVADRLARFPAGFGTAPDTTGAVPHPDSAGHGASADSAGVRPATTTTLPMPPATTTPAGTPVVAPRGG